MLSVRHGDPLSMITISLLSSVILTMKGNQFDSLYALVASTIARTTIPCSASDFGQAMARRTLYIQPKHATNVAGSWFLQLVTQIPSTNIRSQNIVPFLPSVVLAIAARLSLLLMTCIVRKSNYFGLELLCRVLPPFLMMPNEFINILP